MKSKLLFLSTALIAMLLTSCNGRGQSSTADTEESSVSTSESTTGSASSEESVTSSTGSSSSSSSSTSTGSSSSSTSESLDGNIPASGESLPIGNTTVSGPTNTSRINLDDYTDFDLKSSLPQYFSYIQGNNKVNTCTDFYDNDDGGFKFSHLYYGFQTPLIENYKKLECRLYISQISNSSKTANKNKEILHYYFYNTQGHYLGYKTQAAETITSSQVGSYVKFYVTRSEIPDIAYMEVRLNYYASKGSQCYNFGVSKLQLKGWDYE